jgi:hypothetical protein
MTQYIPKDALVAEINKRIIDAPIDCYGHQRVWAYNDVKDIINTMEVKGVDLDFAKEVDVWMRDNEDTNGFFNPQELAKHFFELGLKAQKKE